MKYYVLRNYTVENLFDDSCSFSIYNALNIEKINKWDGEAVVCFLMYPLTGNYNDKISAVEANIETLKMLIDNCTKRIILLTMHPISKSYHPTSDFKLSKLVNEYNEICWNSSSTNNNVICFDYSSFLRQYPDCLLIDWKHFYLSQLGLNPKLAGDFKDWFSAQYNSFLSVRKKCLVLDLDNTLWGGVVGEDGMEGIKLGGSYPGNAYEDMQRRIYAAYENGVILSLCSKNNEIDALQIIENHPNMVLKNEHIAINRINWNNKAENIQDIAYTLNIGLDSIVFIDDNPSEREIVKSLLPDVVVPDFPDKPYLLPSFIEEVLSKYFSIYAVTKEDINKTLQYRQNAEREEFKNRFTDYHQYLKELNMLVEMSLAKSFDIPRISQLTQKTNQFNLTTRRYSEDDIRNMINNKDIILCARVKDKFGDYGLTGLCIVKHNGVDSVDIDTLLMSCRVIGREVENEFIGQIIQYLSKLGYQHITSSYFKTNKNSLVESFYENNGFYVIEQNVNYKNYELYTNVYNTVSNNIVEVIWNNERQNN